jgi:hypothetical protein
MVRIVSGLIALLLLTSFISCGNQRRSVMGVLNSNKSGPETNLVEDITDTVNNKNLETMEDPKDLLELHDRMRTIIHDKFTLIDNLNVDSEIPLEILDFPHLISYEPELNNLELISFSHTSDFDSPDISTEGLLIVKIINPDLLCGVAYIEGINDGIQIIVCTGSIWIGYSGAGRLIVSRIEVSETIPNVLDDILALIGGVDLLNTTDAHPSPTPTAIIGIITPSLSPIPTLSPIPLAIASPTVPPPPPLTFNPASLDYDGDLKIMSAVNTYTMNLISQGTNAVETINLMLDPIDAPIPTLIEYSLSSVTPDATQPGVFSISGNTCPNLANIYPAGYMSVAQNSCSLGIKYEVPQPSPPPSLTLTGGVPPVYEDIWELEIIADGRAMPTVTLIGKHQAPPVSFTIIYVAGGSRASIQENLNFPQHTRPGNYYEIEGLISMESGRTPPDRIVFSITPISTAPYLPAIFELRNVTCPTPTNNETDGYVNPLLTDPEECSFNLYYEAPDVTGAPESHAKDDPVIESWLLEITIDGQPLAPLTIIASYQRTPTAQPRISF